MWEETVRIISNGNLDSSKPVYWTKLPGGNPNQHGDPQQCLMFHFALWLSANPDVVEYRAVVDIESLAAPVVSLRGHPFFILFGKKENKTRFEKWLKNYATWFDGKDLRNELIPQIPMNATHTLTFVPTPFARYDLFSTGSYPEGFVDRWAWVIQHCRKPVYMLPVKGFAFANENEGLMYKLKWCEDGCE